jgi:cytochrome c biogenesis protein CcdA
MQQNRIMDQINTIFGAFMVFFYLGVGIYLIFFFENIEKPYRVIMGVTFIFLGVYRAIRIISKIREVFFQGRNDEN